MAKAIISDEKGGKGTLTKIDDGEKIPELMLKACLVSTQLKLLSHSRPDNAIALCEL